MASLGDESSVLSSSSSDKSKSPSKKSNNSQDDIITEEESNELTNEVQSENVHESSLISEKSNNSQVNMDEDLEYSSEIKDILPLSEQLSRKVLYRLSESSVSRNMQSNSITPISSPSLLSQYSVTTDQYSTTTDQCTLEPIDDHFEHIPFNDLIIHQTEINNIQTDEKNNVISVCHKKQNNNKKETQSHEILSVNVCNKGIHEYSFKILDFNVSRLEIGVVSVHDTDSTHLSSKGIKCSEHFGARAVYGMELKTDDPYMYYASYNGKGSEKKERCYRRLTNKQKANNLLWKKGDIIRVWINYDIWKIKFYLNDKSVRKALSLQRNHMYYPIIAFWGDCKYEFMDFK